MFILALLCIFRSIFGDISYSLSDFRGVPLDQKLVEILNFENGIFIEAGANDGMIQSNTKLLEEQYGWTGILIEPSSTLFSRLRSNRPASQCFQCALGSFDENGTYVFGDFDGNLMSSIDGKRLNRPAQEKVLVRSLQSILDEVHLHHIHFFSLDTEGHELNILKGIDFERTTFDYLLIEIYRDQYDKIVSLLRDKGYEMLDCISNYNPATNPQWDGTHNDYLFKRI